MDTFAMLRDLKNIFKRLHVILQEHWVMQKLSSITIFKCNTDFLVSQCKHFLMAQVKLFFFACT